VVTTPAMKIAVITHSGPGDTFWDVVRKGADEAAAKDNAQILYSADPEGSKQSQLIDQAVQQKVDGIVVTLAKPEAVSGAVKRAIAAGIPVVSINSGADAWKKLGVMAHFGQDERTAGQMAGERLASEGVKHPICVIHEQGNVGHEARCQGIKDKVPGTELLNVNGADMSSVKSTVSAKMISTPDADAYVGLGAPFAVTIADEAKASGITTRVVSFDLSAALISRIQNGSVEFAVDQQPWLQGYASVDALWQNKRGGFAIGGGQAVGTGPAMVDKANVAAVKATAQDGIR
jgi:simple sugar transport system substrate-binding protein